MEFISDAYICLYISSICLDILEAYSRIYVCVAYAIRVFRVMCLISFSHLLSQTLG